MVVWCGELNSGAVPRRVADLGEEFGCCEVTNNPALRGNVGWVG